MVADTRQTADARHGPRPERPPAAQPTPADYAYDLFLRAGARLPPKLGYAAARVVGRIRHRARRNSVELNADLRRLVDAPEQEWETWVQRSFELATSEDLEAYLLGRSSRESVRGLLDLKGIDHLRAALDRGRGAILFSGHIRGHHLVFAALAARGYKTNIVGHPPIFGPTRMVERLQEQRNELLEERFGCRFLFMEQGNFGVAVRAANALRRNEVVIMMIDKTVSANTASVRFLGQTSDFPAGPAVLAQATGAPLLDFFVYRPDRWQPQRAEIGPPIVVTDVETAMQECARRLEAHIVRRPEQWYHLWSPSGQR
jgi:lauroyl/myristoyl acyltransferase